MKKFEGKAERGLEVPKKLHYTMMKNEAKEMKSICQGFYAIMPEVRTDFQAIPTEGTDQNYIDRWLEEQKKVIREKVTVMRFTRRLLKSIAGPTDSSTDQEAL